MKPETPKKKEKKNWNNIFPLKNTAQNCCKGLHLEAAFFFLLFQNGLRIFQAVATPEKHKRLGMNRGDRKEHYLCLKIPLVLKWKMEIDRD